MKAVSIKILKDELKHQDAQVLMELCLKLARFKKENKELLSYLLFESSNEAQYILAIKEEIDVLFSEVNTKSYFYIRKSIRKILNNTKKYIRYSKKKETEVELLLHFCKKLKDFKPTIKKSPRVQNILFTQIRHLDKIMLTLHEDLQFDYNMLLDEIKE